MRGPGASMPASRWIRRRPGGPDRAPSLSGCGIRRGSPAAVPPGGKFPMRPERVRRACRSIGGGMGERAIGDRTDQMEGRGSGGASAIVRLRLRSSAALGAHAHAGHASRTLFANATADISLRSLSNAAIFLRRICLCSYYVGHNATAAISTVYITTVDIATVDILHCSYTHITCS